MDTRGTSGWEYCGLVPRMLLAGYNCLMFFSRCRLLHSFWVNKNTNNVNKGEKLAFWGGGQLGGHFRMMDGWMDKGGNEGGQ